MFLDQTSSDPNFFLIQNFFTPNISHPKFFRANNFFQKCFSDSKPTFSFDQKVFCPKSFVDPKFLWESYLGEQFRQITHYLAEQFRQIPHYLAEQFRQITHYLAEQFRQIAHYLAEHLIQKNDI